MIGPFLRQRPARRQVWTALVLAALLGLSNHPVLAQETETLREKFGHQLCETALQGGFPRLGLEDLTSAAAEQQADLCRCTAQHFAAEGREAHQAVLKDMQSGLLRHQAFDRHITENIRHCLATEDEGFGLGEALVNYVLHCEGVVESEARIDTYDLAPLRQQMKGADLTPETICGCAGEYYLHHHETILAEVLRDKDGENSYDRHLAQSLKHCGQTGGVWIETGSDPAFDADISASEQCHAVLLRSIEPEGFDYAAQSTWERQAGLGADELCACVAPRSLDRLAEPDAAGLFEIVLEEIPACRDLIWQP